MSVRKRHNKWWIDFRFNRIRYRKPSPDNTRAGAKAYETLLRYKLARGEAIEKDENATTFKAFAANWLQTYVKTNNKHSEVISKEMILRVHLIPYFGARKIASISNLDIERYKTKKLAENLCPKTINNHLTVIRKSFQCAFEWGVIANLPIVKRLKTPPPKYDFLSLHECRCLTDSAEGIWRDMIKIVLGTGLRFGELIALSWNDIDFDRGELTVRQAFAKGVIGSPKSNQIRYIPLSQSVFEVFNAMPQGKGFIFSDSHGGPLKQIASIKKLHRICREAGIRRIGWHTLRHSFASHLAQAGANLVAIQGLLGHSDIRTTMRYAHINDAALREAISILNSNKLKTVSSELGHNVVTVPNLEVKVKEIYQPQNIQYFA